MIFADYSYAQPGVNWSEYNSPIVAVKVNEGIGPEWIDPTWKNHQSGALSRGVREVWYYHFARPSLNNPEQAAAYFASILGTIRPQDRVVLDLEVDGGVLDLVTWSDSWFWALGYPRKVLYSYESFVNQYLINSLLRNYDLWLAAYTSQKPAVPAGWKDILAWQYTDSGSMAGVTCDLSYYYGENVMLFTEQSSDFANYFTGSGSSWICKQTGKVIHDGNLSAYKEMSTDGESLPTPGLPTSNEMYLVLADGTQISIQLCERGILCYDKLHKLDRQPGLGDSYLLKYEQAYSIPEIAALIPGLPTITKIPDIVLGDIRQLVKDAGV